MMSPYPNCHAKAHYPLVFYSDLWQTIEMHAAGVLWIQCSNSCTGPHLN